MRFFCPKSEASRDGSGDKLLDLGGRGGSLCGAGSPVSGQNIRLQIKGKANAIWPCNSILGFLRLAPIPVFAALYTLVGRWLCVCRDGPLIADFDGGNATLLDEFSDIARIFAKFLAKFTHGEIFTIWHDI